MGADRIELGDEWPEELLHGQQCSEMMKNHWDKAQEDSRFAFFF
jgi:hypothetical protein